MKRYLIMAGVAVAGVAAILHPPSEKVWTDRTTAQPIARARRASVAPARLVVYVAGAVARPGLYRLAAGSRGGDAVAAAGGLRADAEPAGVNLAEVLQDGEEIAAPVRGAPARRRGTRTAHHRGKKRSRASMLVNGAIGTQLDLNAADAAALSQLPGIGVEMARRLVSFREANGAFASIDELGDVSGMTQRRIDAVAPFLFINR